MSVFNIYCDESCHLESDNFGLMTLGSVWCPRDKVKEISDRIKEIKVKYGLAPHIELKWTKISSTKIKMYEEIIDYFFDDDDLHFRGLVAKDKSNLNHEKYGQTHDDWYYKMYFTLLKNIFSSGNQYHIMVDHKDTLGSIKVEKLHEVLTNSIYDFDRNIVKSANIITSDTSTCLQLADLFSGALSYINRSLNSSEAKLKVIEKIKNRSHISLTKSTLPSEQKFNVFIWSPQ
ncbi:DUF3800 domain-containing protein [Halobacteriovorax sp. ZH4_bin.1]|uniref:DUF3800 domain-containing protein n=1 Tax=unclassified Halobacteriovorax TaxID=2639665 RepID=UPI00371FAA58